jgi:predicted CxxxxCH...CXXCH cytochrome family protein
VTPASSSPTATPAGDDRENRTDEYVVLENPGDDTEAALYCHSDGAAWNTGGDTVVVRTPDGEDVVSRSCG